MGFSTDTFHLSLKGMVQESEEIHQVLESHFRRRWQMMRKQRIVTRRNGRHLIRIERSRMVSMKRRARLDGSRSFRNGIYRRVRTLKKLIPNSESMGLEGLFRETADYILSLQMRVKIMQIMVKELSGSDADP